MSNYNNGQPNVNIYGCLAQIQSLYFQYMQIKTQLTLLEDNLNTSNTVFDKSPTQHNLYDVQNIWNQKFMLMSRIPEIVNSIVSALIEATKFVLSSMESDIADNNILSVTFNDNAVASICSLIEQNQYQLHIKELYKQYCMRQNIPMLLNNIEIRAQMMRLSLPNFDHLKKLIRGY